MTYRLALVNYLNTLPFMEGLKLITSETKLEIFPVIPSQCAVLFEEGKVDISLCPIGALSDLPPYNVWGDYCIGADGDVGTVMFLSKVPLEEITSVRFDDHSRTSNLLLQILANRYWEKEWDFYFASDDAMADVSPASIGRSRSPANRANLTLDDPPLTASSSVSDAPMFTMIRACREVAAGRSTLPRV